MLVLMEADNRRSFCLRHKSRLVRSVSASTRRTRHNGEVLCLGTSTVTHVFDVIILGAGAAGLMCAIEAGNHGKRVAVLDRADKIGKKILISGGGRCNFTNIHCRPENFISSNPHFCKSALARYTPHDFVALVSKHKIPYHEKSLGQLFCDGSAREIVAMLKTECRDAGVQIFVSAHVETVQHSKGFEIRTDDAVFSCGALVVATGGLSIPKMGATPLGYQLAAQFGINIQPCRPALVPLLFSNDDLADYSDLAGVAVPVLAHCGRQQFRENMLLTHRGLSGPAILQISSYWNPGDALKIDLAPEVEWTRPWRDPTLPRNLATAKQLLRATLPHRLADRWLELHPPQDWTNHSLHAWERELHHWTIVPAGTEGYAKAEVTTGGIDTNELSAKTMECRKVPGLFFVGEVVEVTGHLGGFNFQWAWASGFCAGQALAA
jgi:predicted Rossmann fold flavoprotein